MTKNDILEKLTQEKEYIQNTFEVDKIGLFGSYARDEATENSDIDIYVEFKNKSFKNISGLFFIFLYLSFAQLSTSQAQNSTIKGFVYEKERKITIKLNSYDNDQILNYTFWT